jgi:hypothetical protein
VLPVFIPVIAVFGDLLVCPGGSVLTLRGSVQIVSRASLGCPHPLPQSLDPLVDAQCLFDGLRMRVRFGLEDLVCVSHQGHLSFEPQD